jgi:hypothetical protein
MYKNYIVINDFFIYYYISIHHNYIYLFVILTVM